LISATPHEALPQFRFLFIQFNFYITPFFERVLVATFFSMFKIITASFSLLFMVDQSLYLPLTFFQHFAGIT
jgi:hypothetical protein